MLTKKKTYNLHNLRDVQKTFNDGVCEVFVANERDLGESKGKFQYAIESVGVGHFYQAYVNNISVDKSISIPLNETTIDTQDVVCINNEWFKIVRIQYHDNKRPYYWTLSLQRSPFEYKEVVSDDNE